MLTALIGRKHVPSRVEKIFLLTEEVMCQERSRKGDGGSSQRGVYAFGSGPMRSDRKPYHVRGCTPWPNSKHQMSHACGACRTDTYLGQVQDLTRRQERYTSSSCAWLCASRTDSLRNTILYVGLSQALLVVQMSTREDHNWTGVCRQRGRTLHLS